MPVDRTEGVARRGVVDVTGGVATSRQDLLAEEVPLAIHANGEPLAVMGEKRVASATALALETDRPTLYIEFRKDGKPVDSRAWWTGSGSGKAQNDS